MMQRLLTWTVLAGLFPLVLGCENNKSEDVASVPPPDDSYVVTPPPAPEPVEADTGQSGANDYSGNPNTITIGGAPGTGSATASAGTTGAGGSYVVRRGDTLWSISRRVYGTGQRWQDLASANGINDPTRLRVGQTLVLP